MGFRFSRVSRKNFFKYHPSFKINGLRCCHIINPLTYYFKNTEKDKLRKWPLSLTLANGFFFCEKFINPQITPANFSHLNLKDTPGQEGNWTFFYNSPTSLKVSILLIRNDGSTQLNPFKPSMDDH